MTRLPSYRAEARHPVGSRRARIGPIIERLTAAYPDAGIALRFENPLELLVAVMLSAQTTDATVNQVTAELFRKYRQPADYLSVPVEELERDISTTGFFHQKARSLRDAMATLIEVFGGAVPTRVDELTRLPGVGPKTANFVAAELGEAQGIGVDTHVRRLAQRLGLTRHDDPDLIERDLEALVPRAEWRRFPHLLIAHGRLVCRARQPRCEQCPVSDLCPSRREITPASSA